jgi:ribonucleoside-diphosphate reductase alpha chain
VKESKPKEEFDYQDALKRPKTLNADWHTTTVKGTKYNVVVGLFNNKAYEIFMFPYIKDLSSGTLSKAGRGVYIYKDTEKGVSVRGLTSIMSDEEEAITRLISTSLRHGADIKFIVEQLNKTSGDLFSFTKGLARILKRYIPKGAKSTVSCLECSSDNVIFEEGCSKCLDCGSSKCG